MFRPQNSKLRLTLLFGVNVFGERLVQLQKWIRSHGAFASTRRDFLQLGEFPRQVDTAVASRNVGIGVRSAINGSSAPLRSADLPLLATKGYSMSQSYEMYKQVNDKNVISVRNCSSHRRN